MDKNIEWEKILRFLSGECNEGEMREMTEWMNSSHKNKEFMLFLEMIWHMEPQKRKEIDADSAWRRFNEKFDFFNESDVTDVILSDASDVSQVDDPSETKSGQQKQTRNRPLNWYGLAGVAASIVLGILLAFQFMAQPEGAETALFEEEIEYREFRTEKGQRVRITLSDGSVIHLNADSYLRLPEMFRKDVPRKVYLEGEAFFEIAQRGYDTFQVIAGETITTVLGTRFNVRSYQEDPEVMVVVAGGRVSLDYLENPGSEPVVLSAKQKGVLGNGTPGRISNVSDLAVYSGWIDGTLIFEQEPIPEMIRKLQRRYGIELELVDEYGKTESMRLTATFSRQQPVDDVLQSISHVLDLPIQKVETAENKTAENSYKLIYKD